MSDRPSAAPMVRAADRDDLAALAAVFVAAWRGGYRGVVPDDIIDAMDATVAEAELAPSLDAPDRTTLVALDADGDIVGFTIFGPDRDRDAGYLASLYVSPAAGGRGLGSSLLSAAIDGMPGVDITLWVFADNVRARRLYERAGFHPDGAEMTDQRWRAVQVRYRRDATWVDTPSSANR
jgi:ribosomal protein S18 acetylase RimI-like enzyme